MPAKSSASMQPDQQLEQHARNQLLVRLRPYHGRHRSSRASADDDMLRRLFDNFLSQVKAEMGIAEDTKVKRGEVDLIIAYYLWTNDREKTPASYGKPTGDVVEEARRQCARLKPYLMKQLRSPPKTPIRELFSKLYYSILITSLGCTVAPTHPDKAERNYMDILTPYVYWHMQINQEQTPEDYVERMEKLTIIEKLRREADAAVHETFRLRRERKELIAKNTKLASLVESLSGEEAKIAALVESLSGEEAKKEEESEGNQNPKESMIEGPTLERAVSGGIEEIDSLTHDEVISKAGTLLAEREAIVRERDDAIARADAFECERNFFKLERDEYARRNERLIAQAPTITEYKMRDISSNDKKKIEQLTREMHLAMARAAEVAFNKNNAETRALEVFKERGALRKEVEKLNKDKDILSMEKDAETARANAAVARIQEYEQTSDPSHFIEAERREKEAAIAKVGELQYERDDAVAKFDAVNREKIAAETRAKVHAKERDIAESKVEELTSEKKETNSKCAALFKENQYAVQRATELTAERDALKKERDCLKTEKNAAVAEIQELKKNPGNTAAVDAERREKEAAVAKAKALEK